VAENKPVYGTVKSAALVSDILTKITKSSTSNFQIVHRSDLIGKASGKINDDVKEEVKPRYGRRMQDKVFSKSYQSRSGSEALKTLIGRNANVRCNEDDPAIREALAERLCGQFFNEVVDEEKFRAIVSNQENVDMYLERARIDTLQKIQEKGQEARYGLLEFGQKVHYGTEFFLKTIEKCKPFKEPPNLTDKNGQTIAANNKEMNTMASIFHRAIDMILKDVAKPHIIFANGRSEKELGDLVAPRIRPGARITEGDFTEFGFTQGNITRAVELKIYERFGLLNGALQLYHASMVNRRFSCKWFSIWVNEGKNDGATNTLLGNDLWNSVLNFDVLSFVDLHLALLKGDDNSFVSGEVVVNEERLQFWKDKGVGFKYIFDAPVLKFVNWFWTEHGAYPDIIYRALKCVCKLFTSQVELAEYQQAIRDFLGSFRTMEEKLHGIGSGHLYHGFSLAEMEFVTDYLHHFAYASPHELWRDAILDVELCFTEQSKGE